jgi:hypothetical protein
MRRILLAGAVIGAVINTAACDAAAQRSADPTPSATSPAFVPSPSPTPGTSLNLAADIKRVCGGIDKSLEGDMRTIGAELGRMIANRQVGDTARASRAKAATQAKLRGMAGRMLHRAVIAQDPDLKAAVQKVAHNIAVTARNDAFFAKVNSTKGIESLLQKEVVRWLMPLSQPCAT